MQYQRIFYIVGFIKLTLKEQGMKQKYKCIIFTVFFTCTSILFIPIHAFAGGAKQIESPEYLERSTLTTSLFKSDQDVLGDEAISKILSSKFELPQKVAIALMKFRSDEVKAIYYYGYNYWRSEDYLKNQQNIIDTLSDVIYKSNRVLEVTLFPDILTPVEPTISVIREAAVRLQADVVLVFIIHSDIYHKARALARDEVKAYSTCEAFILDTRTGLIPFTTIITEDITTKKEFTDINIKETTLRAENEAILKSLFVLGNNINKFLEIVPVHSIKPEEVIDEQAASNNLEILNDSPQGFADNNDDKELDNID
jgi:hypothetical protein